jgi:hypothetical protein
MRKMPVRAAVLSNGSSSSVAPPAEELAPLDGVIRRGRTLVKARDRDNSRSGEYDD